MKILALFFIISSGAMAQFSEFADDVSIGGDIFSDFNDDLESSQVEEDERFYRYSRFFSLNLGVGLTNFTGNRGKAYSNDNPSYSIALMYFLNFQNVFIMGFEYSRHFFVVDTFLNGSPEEDDLGLIETTMLRPFFGFRYYLDTQDLGTAITYSNPYIVGRLEYWYQTNEFKDKDRDDQTGGRLGTGFGFGLEFPIELRKSYFNIEFKYHVVNFFDKYTSDYAAIRNPSGNQTEEGKGFDNLAGDVITIFASYNLSW